MANDIQNQWIYDDNYDAGGKNNNPAVKYKITNYEFVRQTKDPKTIDYSITMIANLKDSGYHLPAIGYNINLRLALALEGGSIQILDQLIKNNVQWDNGDNAIGTISGTFESTVGGNITILFESTRPQQENPDAIGSGEVTNSEYTVYIPPYPYYILTDDGWMPCTIKLNSLQINNLQQWVNCETQALQ